jgi:hypothetical protein
MVVIVTFRISKQIDYLRNSHVAHVHPVSGTQFKKLCQNAWEREPSSHRAGYEAEPCLAEEAGLRKVGLEEIQAEMEALTLEASIKSLHSLPPEGKALSLSS